MIFQRKRLSDILNRASNRRSSQCIFCSFKLNQICMFRKERLMCVHFFDPMCPGNQILLPKPKMTNLKLHSIVASLHSQSFFLNIYFSKISMKSKVFVISLRVLDKSIHLFLNLLISYYFEVRATAIVILS